jgi:hypothetical protein
MDAGYWNDVLDHSRCPECWRRIGGGPLLDAWRGDRGEPWQSVPAERLPAVPRDAPADRARATAALRAYVGPGLPRIEWVASPIEVVGRLLKAIHSAKAPLDPARRGGVEPWSIRARAGWADEDDPSGDPEPDASQRSITSAIATTIRERDPEAVGDLGDLVARILADAGQLAAPGGAGELGWLLDELRDSAGPLVVLKSSIVISERPLRCALDDRGRPHAVDGPAIAYGDGLAVFAWHGVVVPDWVITDSERLSVAVIDAETNIEVRRVMVERFGPERLVREGGATLVHEDETGRLWRRPMAPIQLPGDPWRRPGTLAEEPVAYVEVLNTTPEPDGSRKTYFLRVPPTIETARAAVAWTFGMAGVEYRPTVEA